MIFNRVIQIDAEMRCALAGAGHRGLWVDEKTAALREIEPGH
jgi:hypothetical protein